MGVGGGGGGGGCTWSKKRERCGGQLVSMRKTGTNPNPAATPLNTLSYTRYSSDPALSPRPAGPQAPGTPHSLQGAVIHHGSQTRLLIRCCLQ